MSSAVRYERSNFSIICRNRSRSPGFRSAKDHVHASESTILVAQQLRTIQNLSDVFIDPLRAEYNRVAKILILIEIKDISENMQGAK